MSTITAILKSDGTLVEVMPDGSERALEGRPMRKMTEQEIIAAAMSDPDNPPMTEEELSRMRPVAKSKRVRWKLGLGREEFARRYRIPLDLITAWEHYKAEPDAVANAYLDAIDGNPEAVDHALQTAASLKAAE